MRMNEFKYIITNLTLIIGKELNRNNLTYSIQEVINTQIQDIIYDILSVCDKKIKTERQIEILCIRIDNCLFECVDILLNWDRKLDVRFIFKIFFNCIKFVNKYGLEKEYYELLQNTKILMDSFNNRISTKYTNLILKNR